MDSKGRESWDKRQRERTKKDKQAAKRAERAERRNSENELEDEGPNEAELYERFAKLSASHANGESMMKPLKKKKKRYSNFSACSSTKKDHPLTEASLPDLVHF